jgi:hypothetical protein
LSNRLHANKLSELADEFRAHFSRVM